MDSGRPGRGSRSLGRIAKSKHSGTTKVKSGTLLRNKNSFPKNLFFLRQLCPILYSQNFQKNIYQEYRRNNVIDKKVALITGASRGIGRAIALKFAKEGMAVALTARNESLLGNVSDEISALGGDQSLMIPADLRDISQIPSIPNRVVKEWGRIDILVNNAGLGYLKPFLEIKPEEFQEMLDVNLRAVFLLTQGVLPHMIARKTGNIVNIASLAGKNGFKTGTGYAATKWALRGFAQCLMLEVREHDIRVVTIFPGSVETEFGRGGASLTGTPSQNKIQAIDIAETAYLAVNMPDRSMLSEIDMRPSNPARK
jgi:NADP-dependent 3-hydroxy acid dehydrogenase YdfG